MLYVQDLYMDVEKIFFFDYFREAWLKNIEYMPIIGDGLNHIPTIQLEINYELRNPMDEDKITAR